MELVISFVLAAGVTALIGVIVLATVLEQALQAQAKLEQDTTKVRIDQVTHETTREVAELSDNYLRTVRKTLNQTR